MDENVPSDQKGKQTLTLNIKPDIIIRCAPSFSRSNSHLTSRVSSLVENQKNPDCLVYSLTVENSALGSSSLGLKGEWCQTCVSVAPDKCPLSPSIEAVNQRRTRE